MHRITLFFHQLLSLNSDEWQNSSTNRLFEFTKIKKDQYISLLIATLLVCIGLNTGSQLSIIGGLILFPIVGPFYGFGFGLISLNLTLIQQAIQSILITIFLVLLISYIYFWITPIYVSKTTILEHANFSFSELFVAAVAGIAGFIAIIRKKSAIILIAVHIATAMMVPLCLASYGAKFLDSSLIISSLSLFLLIAFFILLGAIVLGMILGVRIVNTSKFQKILLNILGIIVLVVGIYSSVSTLKSSIVAHNVSTYLSEELSSKQFTIQSKEIEIQSKKVVVYYSGIKPLAIQDPELKKKHKVGGYNFQFIEI